MLQPGVALLALRAALLESILTALDLHPNRETPRGLTHKTKMQPALGLATKLVKQIFLKCQGPSASFIGRELFAFTFGLVWWQLAGGIRFGGVFFLR